MAPVALIPQFPVIHLRHDTNPGADADPNNGFRAYRLGTLDDPHTDIWQKWLDRYEMRPTFYIALGLKR